MRNAIILFMLFALTACSSPSSKEPLTLEQVITAFENEKLQLQAADANPMNIVQQGINGVQPSFYSLNNNDTLYLFIFKSEADRKQGREDFYNRPVDFAAHSTYEINNALVLWFYGEDAEANTDGRIRTTLSHLGTVQQ
ncbi:hypothetical protein H8B09_24310 [Paenibacillus sp. PR3]|uniref:Lipoprotein n=1 Tax=Paenibacillus terricola TaxID=2763503 RepID=A0ABR8N3C6_9BACL|nr:hypothetical protein [Paenibacillus terricola]MBD3921907.1 hypothetical protein [Paenibacillus terricola]